MERRPDYVARLTDFPFENNVSPRSRRDTPRKTEEFEERMTIQVRKLQTDVNELGGLSSFVTFLDKRTVQMENQLSSLVRTCADLSGKCTGLLERMQEQIRSNKKLDEDCRSKCRDLENRLQRAFTADVKPLEHSVSRHGQQLKAIENSIQTIENSIEAMSKPSSPDRQSFVSEVDVGVLSEKVQQVVAAVSKQSDADTEMRSELARLKEWLSRGRDDAESLTKALAQALERLEELPEIRIRLEKLEESAHQFGPRETSPPRAISSTGTCPLPASSIKDALTSIEEISEPQDESRQASFTVVSCAGRRFFPSLRTESLIAESPRKDQGEQHKEASAEFDIEKAESQLKEVRRQAEEFSKRLVSLRKQRINSCEAAKTSRRCQKLMDCRDVIAKEAQALQLRLERMADDALVTKEEGRHSPAGNVTHMTHKLVSLESEVKALSQAVSQQSKQQKERCEELASVILTLGSTVAQIQGRVETEPTAAAATDSADRYYIGT